MGNYLRIARAYLCGTSVVVWCFLFFCLVTYLAVGENLARNPGAVLGGIFSKKSYLAMFAYFNACLLGVLLRDNIAHPWGTVLPHYRQKHLGVAAILALVFLAIPMFCVAMVGTSDIALMSVAVIFFACLAAGLWTLHHPVLGVLAFPFLAFVMVPASSFPGLVAFLAGAYPAASAVLLLASLLALCAFAWRMLALDEEGLEYATARMWGDLLRGQGGQMFRGQSTEGYLAALPAVQRAPLQNRDSMNGPFTNLRQVDSLSGYCERSLWQRLQLWRLGTGPTPAFASVGLQILISLAVIPLLMFFPRLMGLESSARDSVVIMSVMIMTNPFNIWISWFMRLHRLGYESLRPRTRQEFVCELGLALLWDIVQCWIGGILFMGIAAAIWAPELLQAQSVFLFLLGTGVGQLGMYAMMGNWLLKRRGMAASISYAFCPFLAMVTWVLWIGGRIGVELNVVIASILAAASLVTIAMAYRRWCKAELE